jgi:hypothetical protein
MRIQILIEVMKFYKTGLQTVHGSKVSFHGSTVSLHGSIMGLLGSRLSLPRRCCRSVRNTLDPDPAFHFDADPDPALKYPGPCGSGSATMNFLLLILMKKI